MLRKIKEYQKHIVSTPKHQVWLHRTKKHVIDNIMKEGFFYRSNLGGVATLETSDLTKSENSYRSGTHYGDAVVVIKIPKELIRDHKSIDDYDSDRSITYWHPESANSSIQRQHVHGWIDRETDEYHPNPYLNKPQVLTEKHFPAAIYGGLEKKTYESQSISEVKTKRFHKRNKNNSGNFPPPLVYDPRLLPP